MNGFPVCNRFILAPMDKKKSEFDLDGVDRVMKQLDEYRVPACIQDHMEKLRICVADVAMEDIMNLTTTMVDLLRE